MRRALIAFVSTAILITRVSIPILLLLLIISPYVYSEGGKSSYTECDSAVLPPWDICVGYAILHHSYEEPGMMQEKGWFSPFNNFGGNIEASVRRFYNGNLGSLDLLLGGGYVKYDGMTQNGQPLQIRNIPDVFLESRFAFGRLFYFSPNTYAVPFGGAGVRYWIDDLSKHKGGYERRSLYVYSPIGIELWHRPEASISTRLGAKIEYDLFWEGRQFSKLSDLNRTYRVWTDTGITIHDAINHQDEGYGLRASMTWVTLISERRTVELTFFVRSWQIAASDVVEVPYKIEIPQSGFKPPLIDEGTLLVYEPKNNTLDYGIFISVHKWLN